MTTAEMQFRFRCYRTPFHDGAPLTADDVVASLKRATDDASPLKGNLSAFRDAHAVDPATLDVDLNSAYPLLLNDLTNIFIFSKPWLLPITRWRRPMSARVSRGTPRGTRTVPARSG